MFVTTCLELRRNNSTFIKIYVRIMGSYAYGIKFTKNAKIYLKKSEFTTMLEFSVVYRCIFCGHVRKYFLNYLLGLPSEELTFSNECIYSGSELDVKKGKVLVFHFKKLIVDVFCDNQQQWFDGIESYLDSFEKTRLYGLN